MQIPSFNCFSYYLSSSCALSRSGSAPKTCMQKSKKKILKNKIMNKKMKKQTNSFPINEIQYIIGIEHETASNIHMASNMATRRQLKQSIFLTLKCLNHWLQKAPYHMLQPRDWHQATSVLTGKEIKNILTGKKTRERRYK
jgi:hypothetical protein